MKFPKHALPFILFPLALHASAQPLGKIPEVAPSDPRLQEQPARTLTAGEILDGTVRWNVPPRPRLAYKTDGFDASRLGKTPAPGVHPRLYTSPGELPAARARLETTAFGRKLLGLARKNQAEMRSGKGAFGPLYATLKTGLMSNDDTKRLHNRLMNELAVQALLAQMYDDRPLLDETAAVSMNLIRSFINYYHTIPKIEGFEDMVIEALHWNVSLAQLYDFTAPALGAGDRKFILDFIKKETDGKWADGMNLPPPWRMWNHIAAALNYPFTMLAFEKEAPLDERILARGAELAGDYYTWQFSPEGMSTEGQNYTLGQSIYNFPFLAALARRGGENLLAHPRIHAMLDWAVHTLSPNPDALWETGGDTGTRSLLPWEMMIVLKTYYPDDARIDYLLAHCIPEKPGPRTPNVAAYVFCREPGKSKKEYDARPPAGTPLTYYAAGRGYFSARNAWGRDAVKFTLEARRDTFFLSHDHSDRGAFTLSANGRDWVVDGFRSTQSQYHSVVIIDGAGQGYFPTPCSWLDCKDSPEATVAVIDQKYSYDWSWLKTPVADMLLDRPVPAKWAAGVYADAAANLKKYFPGQRPVRDPLQPVAEMYSGNLYKNALIWKEDTWPMRLECNPVRHAFRTAALIKGGHAYALIVDDIKKDDNVRLYEWLMPMPLDVELVGIKQLVSVRQQSGPLDLGFSKLSDHGAAGDYDMMLGDKTMPRDMRAVDNEPGWEYKAGRFTPRKGNPQLLVRVLEKTSAPRPNLEPNPSLQTIEHLKTEDMHQFYLRSMGLGKRLVIPARAAEGAFKVLLFPCLHGDEQPETEWNAGRTRLTVSWHDQKDIFTFIKQPDGRTVVGMERNGRKVF
ncbi:MAG: heparinase II/III-family protein [Opitutaceae bacterium]|jgi:hypothetical protein|nr:heparinase II/III-family protein [Opitutaceae bacterium]